MRKIHFLLLLFQFWIAPSFGVTSCNSTGDCPADEKYCDEFNECQNCCGYDYNLCPTPDCTQHAGSSECRNDVGTACNIFIRELPRESRDWTIPLIAGLAALLIGSFGKLGYTYIHKKRKNEGNS